MTFSQYAGIAIVPTLARIVLCVAFVIAGYQKAFQTAVFDETAAERLRRLGVDVMPESSSPGGGLPANGSAGALKIGDGRVVLASLKKTLGHQQDEPGEGEAAGQEPDAEPSRPQSPQEPSTPAQQPPTSPPVSPPSSPPSSPPTSPQAPAAGSPGAGGSTTIHAVPAPLPPGNYRADGMHVVTLTLESHGWPAPVWMARLVTFTELVGGALLAVGLFSRLWGLGLAIIIAVSFYMSSFNTLQAVSLFDIEWSAYNWMFRQAGLFVLAFGVFLTGPGPLSLDRLFFSREEEVVVKTVDREKN